MGYSDTTSAAFTIETRETFPISRFIYGINGYGYLRDSANRYWPRGITLSRFGGNRLSAYNWTTGASNAGRDWNYNNDDYLGGSGLPGEAARIRVAGARSQGAGIIVTVPMMGHVARDVNGTTVGTDPATLKTRLATRFVPSYPTRGAPLPARVSAGDTAVFQDEFVRWLVDRFPTMIGSDSTPLFFGLDNEPDLWGATHEELLPKVSIRRDQSLASGWTATEGQDARARIRWLVRAVYHRMRDMRSAPVTTVETDRLTYDELIDRTIAYSSAIKTVEPRAIVLGPGTATWTGATTLARWPSGDPRYESRFFLDVYLDRMRDAQATTGRRLLDVLDIHWYSAATADGYEIGNDLAPQTPALVNARMQAPRSLWDPSYDEQSWVSRVQSGPIRLLPFLREHIAAHYPGTRLAITEYYYGRGGDISGGIAQADVLGIFGREGVFAATLWPNGNAAAIPYGGSWERAYRYVIGAFRMYRDFDGSGGAFGSIGLAAQTSDPVRTSIYASTDDPRSARVVLVAINKSAHRRRAIIALSAAHGWRGARTYVLTAASAAPRRGPEVTLDGASSFAYDMPPLSVTTLVLSQ